MFELLGKQSICWGKKLYQGAGDILVQVIKKTASPELHLLDCNNVICEEVLSHVNKKPASYFLLKVEWKESKFWSISVSQGENPNSLLLAQAF